MWEVSRLFDKTRWDKHNNIVFPFFSQVFGSPGNSLCSWQCFPMAESQQTQFWFSWKGTAVGEQMTILAVCFGLFDLKWNWTPLNSPATPGQGHQHQWGPLFLGLSWERHRKAESLSANPCKDAMCHYALRESAVTPYMHGEIAEIQSYHWMQMVDSSCSTYMTIFRLRIDT